MAEERLRPFRPSGLVKKLGRRFEISATWQRTVLAIAACGTWAVFTECLALEKGSADRGRWEVVWRYDETNGVRTEFQPLHKEGTPFPFTWRHWNDTRGNRLQLLDETGAADRRIDLGPGERALASENGSAWIILSPDATARDSQTLHFFRKQTPDRLWDAFTGADPVLFSNDGSFLVLAAHDERYDQWSRRILDGGGRLQVIGGEAGEILGELPIYPIFARMSGDGKRIALLRDDELFVLHANGRIAWKTDVPVNNMVSREGLSHLATASDLIVVSGTGKQAASSAFYNSLHPRRREELLVFDTSGKLLWESDDPAGEELRFNLACAISPDGSTLATLRDTEREQIVTAYEARTGEKLFVQRTRRRTGARTLALSPGGELISLAFGDAPTGLTVWNRNGDLVWEGTLPLRSVRLSLHAGNLLAAEDWVVRLIPESPEP